MQTTAALSSKLKFILAAAIFILSLFTNFSKLTFPNGRMSENTALKTSFKYTVFQQSFSKQGI
jgi:hypothetical protein